jgi:VCBS repeat-containing protein
MKTRLILLSALAIFIMVVLAVVIVSTVNHAPTAQANSVTTREDTLATIVLAAEDRNKNELTYSVIDGPSHGRLSGTPPKLMYRPDADFAGPDSFTFKASDGKTDSAPATVSIMVTPVNDLPTANADSATVSEDAPIVTIDVLANDTDVDADRLIVVNATQGSHGSVTINNDGTLTYAPERDFCGADTFNYTLSDGKGGTDKAAVKVTVSPLNDAPKITSRPDKTIRVWASYTYEVEARDPDPQDKLVYSLIAKPEGMTIDPAAGLIEWRPTSAQAGTYDVQIQVADSNSVPATDTQSFALTVTSLKSPLTATLTVADCFSRQGEEKLSLKDKIALVQTSDGNGLESGSRSETCYAFTDPSIPTGAKIKSVVIYVEHFEDNGFPPGRLEWLAGTGFSAGRVRSEQGKARGSADPVVWASVAAPIRQGRAGKSVDTWDVTGAVETPEKVNALEVQVLNNDTSARRKTSIDSLYAIVEWY